MGQQVAQEAARKEKVLGRERIVIPLEEKKEKVKRGRERRAKVRGRMSSKTEGKDSNRGLKNDPKDERGSAEVEEQRQQRALELDEEI